MEIGIKISAYHTYLRVYFLGGVVVRIEYVWIRVIRGDKKQAHIQYYQTSLVVLNANKIIYYDKQNKNE